MQLDNVVYEICLENTKLPLPMRKTWAELAQQYGFESGESLRGKFKRYRKELGNPVEETQSTGEYKESFQILSDGSQTSDRLIEICEKNLKSPKYLLEAHGFDPELWEITHATNNKWHGPVKGGNKQTLYQSKITVKPIKEPFTEKLFEKVFEKFGKKEFTIPKVSLKGNYPKDGELLFLPVVDLHLGLFAQKGTNNDEYNVEIAKRMFYETISKTLERVKDRNISRILFLVGNDFINSDNLSNTTTKGTPQDSYPFWYDLIDNAIEIIVSSVNTLLQKAPVDIVNIRSNHDDHSMYGVIKAVELYYKNNPSVTVDVSPLPRKYYTFGKSLLGLSHDLSNKKSLQLMSTEGKDSWASCDKFYWFLAHLHTAMQYERIGLVETYRLPTFSGMSRWANDAGFLSVDKRTQCFIFDKENGITDILNVYVK